jgi:hypothetical protein
VTRSKEEGSDAIPEASRMVLAVRHFLLQQDEQPSFAVIKPL